MVDRLIAALVGALCGLAMAFVWGLIAFRFIGICYDKSEATASIIVCESVKGIYWVLLVGPPMVGLIFGSDTLIKWLSRLWGTDKQSGL
jgi:hypothetical protein